MKKKSHGQWSVVLMIFMVLFMFGSSTYGVEYKQNGEAIISIDVDDTSKTNNLMSYAVDVEGNISGPEDFTIDNGNLYVLNSANNTVLKYIRGKVLQTIALDDVGIKGIKIASDNDNLYVLGNDYSIKKIDSNGILSDIEHPNNSKYEAITDFNVINDYLYVSTSEGDYGTTYKVDLCDTTRSGKKIDSFEGRVFDENTTYKVKLMPEVGKSLGHSCILTISDINTGKKSITLTSDYWVAGAQYLGITDNGDYTIKLFELASKPDYTIAAEETIRIISPEGDLKDVCVLDKQVKSIANQTKTFSNEIYHLNNLNNVVQIVRISIPEENSAEGYHSVFDNTAEPKSQLPINDSSITAIKRSTIMANARSFHSSFTWTCTDANLAALTNWTKPRYVGSAGTYSYMPYCWGGFSSISQYNSGMSTGGRVGNINTSTSGHVANTYGLDCSGYVSRCWGLTTHHGTGQFANISTVIDISNILEGDALNNHPSHIVLFEEFDSSGNFILYESTKLNSYDRVSHTIRSASSMSNYTPIRYNNVN